MLVFRGYGHNGRNACISLYIRFYCRAVGKVKMKIFNIIITTKENQRARELEAFQRGWDACKRVEDDSTWSAINPVIHSLKELRNNTWDVERVDKAINWLKDNFEVK